MPVTDLYALDRNDCDSAWLEAEVFEAGAYRPADVAYVVDHPWPVYRMRLADSYPPGSMFRTRLVCGPDGSDWSAPLAYVPEPGVSGLIAGALLLAALVRWR